MNDANYRIRTMKRPELDLCTQWAEAEGWNPGIHDAEAFYAADPQGFLVGLLNEKPIACISAVRYGEHFGFIGLYIVSPEHRQRGFGLQLWHAAMQHLNGRIIGLDGVVAQQNNYRKSGFEFAYNSVRYQGIAETGQRPDASIVDLKTVHETALATYDRQFFPAPRTSFLASWASRPGTFAKASIRQGALEGYGVIRPCKAGYKIGPLFADNPKTAQSLYAALINEVEPGAQIQIDVPSINQDAIALAENNTMQAVFETARMYAGKQPAIALTGIFGITSFELG